MKKNIKFVITEHIATLSPVPSAKGWSTELNRVSWDDRDPQYDIRAWSPDHTKMGKGICLSAEELMALASALAPRSNKAVKQDTAAKAAKETAKSSGKKASPKKKEEQISMAKLAEAIL